MEYVDHLWALRVVIKVVLENMLDILWGGDDEEVRIVVCPSILFAAIHQKVIEAVKMVERHIQEDGRKVPSLLRPRDVPDERERKNILWIDEKMVFFFKTNLLRIEMAR